MKNSIVIVNGQKQDLNGLPVSERGTTMYKNVSYCNVNNHGGDLNFKYIAIAGLNAEEQKLAEKNTFMFHLAFCDTALEAAYIANEFDINRDIYVRELRNITNGNFSVDIPKFEYEQLDNETTLNARASVVAKTNRKQVKQGVSVKIDNRLADSAFGDILKKVDIKALVAKYGKETLLQARKLLTVNEFELRFGIK